MRSLLLVVLTTLFFSGELAFAYAGDLYGHGIWGELKTVDTEHRPQKFTT